MAISFKKTLSLHYTKKKYMDLSIIIPIYNVEIYVRACIESIYKQGLDEKRFEVIIVNDGTTDNSMDMIADIIDQHSNIIIINQENQGLSVARNNGIARATGEYIFMPDPDDLVNENSLSPLLKIAVETKVDMVVANYLMIPNEELDIFQGITQQDIVVKEKNGEQLLEEDFEPNQCYVWRSLFRKSFLLDNHIKFVPGITYQDIPFTYECYLKVNRSIRTSRLLYIYRTGRRGAATSSFNFKKGKDFSIAISKLWKLTNHSNYSHKNIQKINDGIFISFSLLNCMMVHALKVSDCKILLHFLMEECPNLHFTNGFKQLFVSFLYRRCPSTFIYLRYYYGIIFEDIIIPLYYHLKYKLKQPTSF